MKRLIVWKFWPSRCRLVKYFCWRVINTQGFFKYHLEKTGVKFSKCHYATAYLSWITSSWYKMVHTILFLWSLKFLIAFLHHNTHSKASLLWVRGNFLQSAGSGLNPRWIKLYGLSTLDSFDAILFGFEMKGDLTVYAWIMFSTYLWQCFWY